MRNLFIAANDASCRCSTNLFQQRRKFQQLLTVGCKDFAPDTLFISSVTTIDKKLNRT